MIHTREDFLQFVRLVAEYGYEDLEGWAYCRFCDTYENVDSEVIHKDTCPVLQARVIVKAMEAGTDES